MTVPTITTTTTTTTTTTLHQLGSVGVNENDEPDDAAKYEADKPEAEPYPVGLVSAAQRGAALMHAHVRASIEPKSQLYQPCPTVHNPKSLTC